MFGELPKLFGRDFAIGFLLPMAVLIPVSFLIADSFDSTTFPIALEGAGAVRNQPTLFGATIFVFFLWLGGVTLLALNRTIIRFKEGYGYWNPARLLRFVERRRFGKLRDRLKELDNEYLLMKNLEQAEAQNALKLRRSKLSRKLVERFPDQEEHLLPTAFGNTIRAFEVYPRVMYGIDAIPLWPRLLMVMPEDARTLVDSAKSEMDFWLNLWVVSLLLVVEYLAFALFTQNLGNLWLLFLVLLLLPISSNRARVAAAGWGEMVKAAFDVHLAKLRQTFEMKEKQDRKTEREHWQDLSVALIYSNQKYLPPREDKKSAGPTNTQDEATKVITV